MNLQTYLVTDDRLSTHGTVETVTAAIEGGVDIVQLREKSMTARDRYELGRRLRELTREAGVPLVVNDRIDLAAAIDADGVHLGDDDLPVAVAREQLGEGCLVGRSVSTVEAAREAADAGADYLGVGAVFATGSKETDPASSSIGLDRIRAIDDAVDLPFVGIGGIDATNADAVTAAGADGVAVITAITDSDDPEAATRDLRRAAAGVEGSA